MHIIIVGCSKLGALLSAELSDDGHDVCVVDRNANKLAALGSGFNGLTVRGVEYDNDVLKEAGIEKTDYIISIAESDSINITVSLIAKKIYKVPRIIAIVNDPNKKAAYEGVFIETINPIEISAFILKSKIEEAPNESNNNRRRKNRI
jgi:trk system potassium uptake protein TrkA